MDDRRFDDLTKTAGTARSRRTVFGAIVAAAFGAGATGAVRGVAAQDVGTEAFNLTCRQTGTAFFCQADAGDVTTCGPNRKGCLCAEQRSGGAKCIQEPASGCPTQRSKCRNNRDCGTNEVCITVTDCCPDSPNRGKCVAECPA